MKQLASAIAILFFTCSAAFAQNLLITSVNPDSLYVCGEDVLSVTLQNTQANAVTGLVITVVLPPAVDYVLGTVVNAAEGNIGNLNQPQFNIGTLASGGAKTFTIKVRAGCGLVEAINAGQLFNNQIVANWSGGSAQITTTSYKIETGLVVIASVIPLVAQGEIGQVIQRKITFRNTRLGRIDKLDFSDGHFPGISIAMPEASVQNGASPVLFTAEIDGAFFSTIGDGDQWLEFDEEGTITENITITDCGLPSFDNPSVLRLGWGCGVGLCQYDSLEAVITILESTQNPNLAFVPIYEGPTSYCGSAPAIQQLLVINNGNLPANNVLLDFRTDTLTFGTVGIDYNSFATNSGSGWSPLTPNLGTQVTLTDCNLVAYNKVLAVLPEVLPHDTVIVRFETRTCTPLCFDDFSGLFLFSFYPKTCPADGGVSNFTLFKADTASLRVRSEVRFDIGECLVDGQTYPLEYFIRSKRLQKDTGYLVLQLDLPVGLSWGTDCAPKLEGNAPISVTQTPMPANITRVRVVFDLPIVADTAEVLPAI